ncbi:MAG: hypothetical protein IKQ96_11005 [Lachnospiraceae bacterium]|nr:hypothetical protein [Lachnospiraceae bacterium]
MRKWGFKLLVGLVILLLAGIIGSFVYLIKARMQLVEFRFQIETIMTAASMAVDEWDLPTMDKEDAEADGGSVVGGAEAGGVVGSIAGGVAVDDAAAGAAVDGAEATEFVLPDLSKAIVAEYKGTRTFIVPGNYRALLYYLELDPAMTLFRRPKRSEAIRIDICGIATVYAAPLNASGERVLVELQVDGKTFVMQVHGYEHWEKLLACCTKGTYHDENVPLP